MLHFPPTVPSPPVSLPPESTCGPARESPSLPFASKPFPCPSPSPSTAYKGLLVTGGDLSSLYGHLHLPMGPEGPGSLCTPTGPALAAPPPARRDRRGICVCLSLVAEEEAVVTVTVSSPSNWSQSIASDTQRPSSSVLLTGSTCFHQAYRGEARLPHRCLVVARAK